MSFKKAFRVFLISMLFLIILVPALSIAADTTHGYIRVVGYKDPIPKPAGKFTPYAIFQDIPHAKGISVYIGYDYTRYGLDLKCWELWLADSSYNSPYALKSIKVCLPYPSIWSDKEGAYWKWTKNYADKHYDWYYSKGYESYYLLGIHFHGTPLRHVDEMNEFGLMINIGSGLTSKSVMIHFVPAGSEPDYDIVDPISGYEEDEDDW